MKYPILSLLLIVVSVSSANAEIPTLEKLLEDCESKTIVMARDPKGELYSAGKKISGYCLGFMDGILASLIERGDVCLVGENDRIDPSYLLSVLEMHVERLSEGKPEPASTIADAFKRAFACN